MCRDRERQKEPCLKVYYYTKIYCGMFRFILEVIIRGIKDTKEKLPCTSHRIIHIAMQVLTSQFCKR